jgi:hypothetical protein
MSNFKITFGPEWDTLRKNLQSDTTLERVVPDVSIAILKLHNTLERRVDELFTNKDKLSSVLIGNSKAPSEIGKTFLRYSLQYRFKSVPYTAYNFSTSEVAVKSFIPFRIRDNFIRYTSYGKATAVSTEYRRGKSKLIRRVKGSPFKGFIQNGIVYARVQKRTWNEVPSVANPKGIRAPIQRLFGPSLSTLAAKVYDVDSQVAKAKDKVGDDILTAIIRSYSA